MSFAECLTLLVLAHFAVDVTFQPEFVAKCKCSKDSLDRCPWQYVMMSHCSVHGLAVYLVTGSVLLGVFETAQHFLIDKMKCEGHTNIHVDQAMHVGCKVAWTCLWWFCL